MDYSKSKFENERAELFYGMDPDETAGSVDRIGWAGLFKEEKVIILEDPQGFVWIGDFPTVTHVLEEWADLFSEIEADEYGLIV